MTVDRASRGRAARRRGGDAERQVVAYLRSHGYPDARRYFSGDGNQPGDIDAIPGVVIEVKDVAGSAWPSWCRQAEQAAGPDRVWCVVRRTRGQTDVGLWVAVWAEPGGSREVATFGDFLSAVAG